VRHAGPSEHLFCDIGIWHEVLTVSLHEVLERDGGTPCQALDIVCHQVGVVVAQRDALGGQVRDSCAVGFSCRLGVLNQLVAPFLRGEGW
jgi:hypothetical protein